MLFALTNDALAIQYAAEDLKNDQTIVVATLMDKKHWCDGFTHASEELKMNKEL
jgi:predicted DNA-binding protein (MmcQ/YjbR family)